MEIIDMMEAINPATILDWESPNGSLLNASSTKIVIKMIDSVIDKINMMISAGLQFFIIINTSISPYILTEIPTRQGRVNVS